MIFKFKKTWHFDWSGNGERSVWIVYFKETGKRFGELEEIDSKYTDDFVKNGEPTFYFDENDLDDPVYGETLLYGRTKEEAALEAFWGML